MKKEIFGILILLSISSHSFGFGLQQDLESIVTNSLVKQKLNSLGTLRSFSISPGFTCFKVGCPNVYNITANAIPDGSDKVIECDLTVKLNSQSGVVIDVQQTDCH